VRLHYSKEYKYYEDSIKNNPCFVATINNVIVASFTSYTQEEIHPHGMYETLNITTGKGIMSLEDCVVAPEHRGHNLEAILGQCIIDDVKLTMPKIHIAYVTVHPDNIASVKNLKKIGFTICKEVLLYGGNRRYIMSSAITL
jgi:ribosomal protein S18 acetylase RimI-like enzyme